MMRAVVASLLIGYGSKLFKIEYHNNWMVNIQQILSHHKPSMVPSGASLLSHPLWPGSPAMSPLNRSGRVCHGFREV